jgi:predicted dehydrogenase
MVKKMKEVLGNGRVDYVGYDFFRTGRKDTDFSTTAIHGIDTTLMLTGGRYDEIDIEYQPLESIPVGNIYISGTTKKGTKVRMTFYPDSGMNGERVVIISGSTTYFLNIPIWDCPDYPGSIRIFKEGVLSKEIYGDRDEMFITSGFYAEHRDFYESIRKGLDSPADMDQHLQSVEIMEAVRRNDSMGIRHK